MKIEINDEGTVTGRYTGNQLSTIDNTTNLDDSSSWNCEFMQMTNKGEMVVATGRGTGEPVKIRGEGEMWTQSNGPGSLNGAKWMCEGESNIRNRKTLIYVEICEKQ